MKNKIQIENFLTATRFTTRKELCEKTGLSDRTVRDLISDLKTRRVVIYSSGKSGYRLAKEYRSMSSVERQEEINQIEHSLNDCKSRVKNLNKSMRKYIAYIEKAKQIELEEQNFNHIPSLY